MARSVRRGAHGTERFIVTRVTPEGTARPDELIVEEPMTIQLDGTVVTTTMRTPGHDFELAAGFCFTEGLLAGAPVRRVRYCANGSGVGHASSTSSPSRPAVGRRRRRPGWGTTSSSCGWCGSDQLDDLLDRLAPLPTAAADRRSPCSPPSPIACSTARACSHAPAPSTPPPPSTRDGEVLLTREDVGRHNAVDKVVGALLLAGDLPATGRGLFVSGRASVEMVQKAWAGGFGTLVAVSAPTALAVHAARRAGLTLVGFVRGDGFNVYSCRDAPPEPLRRRSLRACAPRPALGSCTCSASRRERRPRGRRRRA